MAGVVTVGEILFTLPRMVLLIGECQTIIQIINPDHNNNCVIPYDNFPMCFDSTSTKNSYPNIRFDFGSFK